LIRPKSAAFGHRHGYRQDGDGGQNPVARQAAA
jgi:hypothetical protein